MADFRLPAAGDGNAVWATYLQVSHARATALRARCGALEACLAIPEVGGRPEAAALLAGLRAAAAADLDGLLAAFTRRKDLLLSFQRLDETGAEIYAELCALACEN